MACKHLNSPLLKAPTLSQPVYREDCTRCFDSIDDAKGLDVCLFCFNGACPAEPNRFGHSEPHFKKTGHPLVLNIKRTQKQVVRDEPPQKISKLAIAAETEADRYDTSYSVNCYECDVGNIETTASVKLAEVVNGVLQASTFARQQEIESWELELEACEHTVCLQQEAPRQIAGQDLGHCSKCELYQNLWLCLTCGNLACGRKNHDGSGGNGHGLEHTKTTSHPVAVKLGSLTADGKADVYCYTCNDERLDSDIVAHLAHWGINLADRQKTEKSLTEMNIEQNFRYDFGSTDQGKDAKPIFAPGFTGLKNLGNSCYMNSVLQSLFSTPEFQQRYFSAQLKVDSVDKPAEDLEVQLEKLADGLLSGRYAKPDAEVTTADDEIPHQRGLAPSMFKALVGKGHPEFSTMRQQDSFEFLLHILKLVTRSNHPAGAKDPVEAFRFAMEERLQCLTCNQVRYTTLEQDNITITIPARKLPKKEAVDKDEFQAVALEECLSNFTAAQKREQICPSCSAKEFSYQNRFLTLPTVLAINASRFALEGWVPKKQDVPINVSDSPVVFDKWIAPGGQQAGEVLLPEDKCAPASGGAPGTFVPNPSSLPMIESMGFSRTRATRALYATGNGDAEPATFWLMEHLDDPDIDTPIEQVIAQNSPNQNKSAGPKVDPASLDQVVEFSGAPVAIARQALLETGGSVERAVEWYFNHPEATGVPDTDSGDAAEETKVSNLNLS
jgi:ubiquitin carboxyl-terminal hydrolase 5/13